MNPGWYDDPQAFGWLRYWDGNAWTRHTAPRPPGFQPANLRPTTSSQPRAASFWARLLAYIVDSIAVALPVEIVVFVGWMLIDPAATTELFDRMAGTDPYSLATILDENTGLVTAMSVLSGPAWFAYEYFGLRWWSATPGMLLLRVRVAPDLDQPIARLPMRRILIRAGFFGGVHLLQAAPVVGVVVSTLFLIDCLSMLFDSRKRTWHDRWADTVVVTAPKGSGSSP